MSEATLNGTVNANGETTTVTFEYGLDTQYGSTWPADQSPVTGTANTAVSAVIYELLPNTTYHYRVVATNASSTSYGADMTFTTLPLPPSVVTLAASGIGVDSATLNGSVNARGSSTTVTFEYGTDTNYGTTVTADQSPVTGETGISVSKTITGLTPNTTYHYRVAATNAGGTSYGTDTTFTINAVAPTAVTNAATAVDSETATLNGTVNASGSETTVTFEYGLDTNYGTTITAIQNPVSGTIDTAVSAIIDDVLPNTTYHYRLVATNAGGSDNGADMTFTTLPLPPTAVTNAASSIGTTGATLNGTVNANDGSTTVTFEYGLDTGYGTTVTADQSPVTGSTDTAVSKAITGLTNGSTYHYRVVAVNAGGTTYGADMTFTTGATAPTATTDAASGVGSTGATLNGTVNANGDSTTVTFEYGTSTDYDRTVAATPGTVTGSTNTAVSASVTTLTANTTYHFRVVAVNAGGTSYGVDMTFTTGPGPAVTTEVASAVGTSGATLNGTVNANNESTTVTFEYGLTAAYGTTLTADQSPVTGTTDTAVSKTLTSLSPSTTYHYRVVGQNASGTTYGADMTFITGAAHPNAPTAVTDAAAPVGASGATLNGTVESKNQSTTVTFEYGTDTNYGTTVTADQSPVAYEFSVGISTAISGLTSGTTYHYRVVAQNAYGTAYGADMTFYTSAPAAPTATTGAASSVSAGGATLNGTVNANNFTTTVTFQYGTTASYGTTVTADQSPVTGAVATAVSKTISGLLANTTYHYRVRAQGKATTFGADMTFTTAGSPTAVTNAAASIFATAATLNGTVNANNASTTVTFEYGLDTSYGITVTADQSPVTGSTDTAVSNRLTFLTPNTTYHYRVVATNANDTVYGADRTFTTLKRAPTAATDAASAVSSSGATLNGTVNAKNDSTTVTFQYGTDTNYGSSITATQSPLTGNNNTPVSAVLTGLISNTTYHYRVVAQNSIGTAYGADRTFFTASTTPTATTQAASNIGTTSATLNGLINANNNSTTVTFEFGPDTSYGRTVTAAQSPVTGSSDTAVSVDLTVLTPNTLYHFRVVAQNSSGTAYGADMTFFTGVLAPTVTTAPVTKVTFHTAKSGGNVTDEGAAPVTARGVCWSTSPNPTLADNFTTNDSGPGPFNSTMNKLAQKTTYYVRAYATNSYGTAYGEEFQFTTDSKNVKVTIVKPKPGEVVSGTVTIKVNAKGTAGSQSIAKVEVYIDGTKIAELTKVPFKAYWDTTAYIDGSHTIKAVAYNKNNESSQESITVTVDNSLSGAAELFTNRDRLNFTAVPHGKNGYLVTGAQTLLIDNRGSGTLNWSISSDAGWLSTSPQSGTGAHLVNVSVNPQKGMARGSYSGSLTITDPNASNGTVTVEVRLTIYKKGATAPPFGSFDTPVDGAAVTGNISITGWVLDDIEVTGVTIYCAQVGNKGSGLKALGDAILVDGARPDMEATYPDYPLNYQAGWGYLLMTHLLPNQGNGTFKLVAKATDKEGNIVKLGKKFISIDNANGEKPFGSIDTPGPGETVGGTNFVNFGWALTPQPNKIPTDGSTIIVWVDGVPLGNPVYNQYRKDIAARFPGYNNSSGAVGYFYLDTTAYSNGVHTIAWSVKDDAGNKAGIGSRYFTILNSDSSLSSATSSRINSEAAYTPNLHDDIIENLQDEIDTPEIKVKELEHVEFQVSNHFSSIRGYLWVDGKFRPLPIGSTLDRRTGRFYWDPGAGFAGPYRLVFIIATPDGDVDQKSIEITIEPEFKKID
jgi:phosphodiesterase/alkaline phosphatase D-like protein